MIRNLLVALFCSCLLGCADWGYIEQSGPRRGKSAQISEARHGKLGHRCGYDCAWNPQVVDVRGTDFKVYSGAQLDQLEPQLSYQLALGSGGSSFSYTRSFHLQGGNYGVVHPYRETYGRRFGCGCLVGSHCVHTWGYGRTYYYPYVAPYGVRDGNQVGTGNAIGNGTPVYPGDWGGSSSGSSSSGASSSGSSSSGSRSGPAPSGSRRPGRGR